VVLRPVLGVCTAFGGLAHKGVHVDGTHDSHSDDKRLVSGVVRLVGEELHALHLAPRLVGRGPSCHPLSESGFSPGGPFALAPFEVLLVGIEQRVGFGGGEFTDLGEVVVDHGRSTN